MNTLNKQFIPIERKHIIAPLFVRSGRRLKQAIGSLPGHFRFSPDTALQEVAHLRESGIRNILFFGLADHKDWSGSNAYDDKNAVCQTLRLVKERFPSLALYADVCLCAYTTHGHCGIIKKGRKTMSKTDTLAALAKSAVVYAASGADYVCPSAMAAGQVARIREGLDRSGFLKTKIMSYSAKFASNAYGPFRGAVDSAPRFGDRRAYQLDYRDRATALQRIEKDIQEGADVVMVKPGLWYLDLVYEAKQKMNVPLAVYNVSGEYAMVEAGIRSGLWNGHQMILEIMHSFKRAGADFIITYHAKEIAPWLA